MEDLYRSFEKNFQEKKFRDALVDARKLCSLCNTDDKHYRYMKDNYTMIKKSFEDFSNIVQVQYKATVGIHLFYNVDSTGMTLLQNIVNYLISNNYKVYFYTNVYHLQGKSHPYTFTLSNPRVLFREHIQEKLDMLIVPYLAGDLNYFHDKAGVVFCFGESIIPQHYHGILKDDDWLKVFNNPSRMIVLPKAVEHYREPQHPLELYLKRPIAGIVCISLVENTKQREDMDLQCKNLGIPIQYFLAKRHEKGGHIGCMESHYTVIQMAKNRRWKEILILEDDAVFTDMKTWPEITVPENYDILYLGCNPLVGWKYRHSLLKLIEAYATHAYLVSERVYDLILSRMNTEWWENPVIKGEKGFSERSKTNDVFNRFYVNPRGESYCIYPMIAHQKPGFSSTMNTVVDFTAQLNERAKYIYEQEF